jgi:chemotaxis response regulator CheB
LILSGAFDPALKDGVWPVELSKVEYEERKMSKKEKLIIIGGSAGGPSAAARAKRINSDLEVTMFEQGQFVSYGS